MSEGLQEVVFRLTTEAKVGEGVEKRTYRASVKPEADSFRHDSWNQESPKSGELFFALHVSDGDYQDVCESVRDYRRSGESKPDFAEFLDYLRSRYIHNMPQGGEGRLVKVYKDKGKYMIAGERVVNKTRKG
ncbi:hypothetical protein GF386_05815 [Candidatus Pacearchaeota archaeon]|nr:hypothetical protein [Candidatus Pacearchaeota archaeon]MBD3283610.1 hypothetical protein [Candidatus Pacearchaeota archaeon]